MKYELKKLKGLKRQLNCQIPAQEVLTELNKQYLKHQQKAQIPGYRRGRAPLSLIRERYKAEVQKATALNLIKTHYAKALKSEDQNPLTQPQIEIQTPLTENQDFAFLATFDIHPPLEIDPNFKPKLPPWPPITASKEEALKSIDDFRKTNPKLEQISENRPVQWDDVVKIKTPFFNHHYQVKQSLPGTSYKDRQIQMIHIKKEDRTKDHVILKELIGLMPGETVYIPFSNLELDPEIEKQYQKEKEAVKDTLPWKILSIYKQVFMNLDDQFAYECGMKDLNNMIEFWRLNMVQSTKFRIHNEMRSRVLNQLKEHHPLAHLPEQSIKAEKQKRIDSFIAEGQRMGASHKEIEKRVQQLDSEFHKEAKTAVHTSYVLNMLALKLPISVTEQDISDFIQQNKDRTQDDMSRADIADYLLIEKAVQYLIENAIKSPSEPPLKALVDKPWLKEDNKLKEDRLKEDNKLKDDKPEHDRAKK